MDQTRVTVRRYEDDDLAPVLALLRNSLAGWRRLPDSWFAWKHLENPAGPSLLHVAESAGEIVGFRAFMRWDFRIGNQVLSAVRGSDAAVDQRYRRRGVWQSMTYAQLEDMPTSVRLAFSYGHADTRAGYRKMGWHSLGFLRKGIVPRRLRRIAASKLMPGRWNRVHPNADLLGAKLETFENGMNNRAIRSLISELDSEPQPTLTTKRDLDYLHWRYAMPPGRKYFVSAHCPHGRKGTLFVVRAIEVDGLSEIEVAEMLTTHNSELRPWVALSQLVRRSAGGDFLSLMANESHPMWLKRATEFVGTQARLGHGNEFLFRVLGDVPGSPHERGCWSFSTGDFDPEF